MDFDTFQQLAAQTSRFTDGANAIRYSIAAIRDELDLIEARHAALSDDEHGPPLSSESMQAILWYYTEILRHLHLSLADVAAQTLERNKRRWKDSEAGAALFDEDYAEDEQLPRQFEFHLKPVGTRDVRLTMPTPMGPFQIGNVVNSNVEPDDHYRFHDVLHMALAALLGWSPVLRTLVKRKRKSNPAVDEAEDGARAQDEEESLVSIIYARAKAHGLFANLNVLDPHLLRQVLSLVKHREVAVRSPEEWSKAILTGFAVFRQVIRAGGGVIRGDLHKRTLTFLRLEDPGKLNWGEAT
jgi:MazG C-terminal domain